MVTIVISNVGQSLHEIEYEVIWERSVGPFNVAPDPVHRHLTYRAKLSRIIFGSKTMARVRGHVNLCEVIVERGLLHSSLPSEDLRPELSDRLADELVN